MVLIVLIVLVVLIVLHKSHKLMPSLKRRVSLMLIGSLNGLHLREARAIREV